MIERCGLRLCKNKYILAKIYCALLAFSVIFVFQVQIVDYVSKRYIQQAVLVCVLSILIICKRFVFLNRNSVEKILFSLLLIFAVSIIAGEWFLGGTLLLFYLLAVTKLEYKVIIHNNVLNYYCFILVAGFLVFLLKYFSLIGPTSELLHSSELKSGIDYRNYLYVLVVSYDGSSELTRFMSIFDEPGVVGSLSGLLLISGCQRKICWRDVVLIISGLMSISVAFFSYFIIYFFLKSTNGKLKILILICVSLFFVMIVFPSYEFIIDIFVSKSNNLFNRVDDCFMSRFYADFPHSYFLGNGFGATNRLQCDVSSALGYVYDIGVLGSCLMFLFSILWICWNQNAFVCRYSLRVSFLTYLLWPIIFILNSIQRPLFTDPMFVLCPVYYLWCVANVKKEQ